MIFCYRGLQVIGHKVRKIWYLKDTFVLFMYNIKPVVFIGLDGQTTKGEKEREQREL